MTGTMMAMAMAMAAAREPRSYPGWLLNEINKCWEGEP